MSNIETADTTATDSSTPVRAKRKQDRGQRYYSTQNKEFVVYVRKDVVSRFGPPQDPEGVNMILAPASLKTGAKKQERRAKSEAEHAKIAAMTEAERSEYYKQKRAAGMARKAAERKAAEEAIKAKVLEELRAAGKLAE